MTSERWRLFVAVPIGDDLRRDIAAAVEEWKKRPDLAGLRWTDPESWHVTLAFLGWIDERAVPGLEVRLGALAHRYGPMRVPIGGLGAFPSPEYARVAWSGVADPQRGLNTLAAAARSAFSVSHDPFRPHVTLARARHDPVDLRAWTSQVTAPRGDVSIDQVQLIRSQMGRGPAQYTTIATAVLRTPARA